jgi:hypothetical protein
MRNVIRRAAIVVGATTTALALGTGSALAHECYIANQSETGAKAAGTHSQAWAYFSLVDVLVEEGFWTVEQAACVQSGADAAGVRTAINTMVKVPAPHNHVLGSKNPHAEEKMGDGKGIDQFFSSGQVVPLIMIAQECGAPIPED